MTVEATIANQRRRAPWGAAVHRMITILTLSLLSGACEDSVDESFAEGHRLDNYRTTDSFERRSPDEAWDSLGSCAQETLIAQGDSSLESFMRHIELSNVQLRERGIEFWRSYPTDPRRYRWLLQTVLMSPRYPVDIDAWARNETTLEVNDAQLDYTKIDTWESTYSALREEFWSSEHVSDKERRLLWMGEIEHRLFSMHTAESRGEDVVGADVGSEIVEFAASYPRPFGETDLLEFHWVFGALASGVLYKKAQDLGWTEVEKHAFARDLLATGNDAVANVARRFLSDGAIDEATTPWELLPRYPRNQASSIDGLIAFYHDRAISTRKFREIGLSLWDNYPQFESRLNWFVVTHWAPPTYTNCIPSAIRSKAAGAGAEVILDGKARKDWMRLAVDLRSELESDPQMNGTLLARAYASQLWADVWDVQNLWKNDKNEIAVRLLLDAIHHHYTRFGDANTVSRAAGVVLREPSKYGLSDAELVEFFEPMKNYAAQELQQLAESVRARLDLRNTPFEFEALSFEGSYVRIDGFRGNLVLVDHWATTCASCIDSMPRIHDVYQQYKDKGFEVISIAYDGTSQRKRVERIEKELGLTWTTLDGEGQWEEVSEKYGYQGFPQYMLLNRDGTLFAGTGEVDMGRNLEALLEEMLAAEAAEKEDATVH